MQIDQAGAGEDAPNHPNAKWMGVIAFLSHNMIIGCLMGSFSVMLASVEQRMQVTREMSSAVGAVVIFGSALMGSIAGPMVARYSLRMMLIIGALLSVIGYFVLAYTVNYQVYVGVYLLLFGPSMAIAGSVGPATLVTRWFSRGRGLALGLVHLSFIVAVMPILCNWILENHGAQAVYQMMGLLIALTLLPATLFVRDFPPGAEARAEAAAHPAASDADDSLTVPQILRAPAFWMLAIAAGVIITQIMMLTFNMIPIAESLGITRDQGAILQATMAFSGMAGSIIFGWIADRIGGARGMALLAFNCVVLLAVLVLVKLPFAGLLVVIGLLGLHGAGMVPNISRALTFSLGQSSFSRAFGLQGAMSVPMTMIGIWAMGASFTATGSYFAALLGVAVAMAVMVPLALAASRRPFRA